MNVEISEAAEGAAHAPEKRRGAFLRRGIAFRLLVSILLFSTLVTVVSTAIQLFLDYRRDINAIESRLDEVQSSSLGSLAGSLWHMDADQLRLQLDGLMRLPDMQAMEVREVHTGVTAPLVVAVGSRSDHAALAREYALTYVDRGVTRTIGSFYVEVTLAQVYHRLLVTGLEILVGQGVKTFLVSLFTLYIVWRLVTRHLVDIAAVLDAYDVRQPIAALKLHRHRNTSDDELDRMVAAFNGLCISLERAYADLREANAALERDIESRKEAEAEIIRLNAVLEERVRQRTAELETANRQLSAFSHSVTHDLREPLRRIDTATSRLLEEWDVTLGERGRDSLSRIRAGLRDISQMVGTFERLSEASPAAARVTAGTAARSPVAATDWPAGR